jgi:hypothetical protein
MKLTDRDNLLDDKRVNPVFRRKMLAVLADIRKVDAKGKSLGWPVCLVEVYRSPAQQLKLYLQGITKMRFPKFHGTGRACDFAFVVDGHLTYKVPPVWWDRVGVCAEGHGLEWSKRWKHNRELCHLQYRGQ